jgi:thioredoxin reductase
MIEIPNRVCIIGAGASGIAACKVLKDHGIPFDCYEASDRVGGVWAYENPNGMSSAYKSLHINTSKKVMQYSDYPMPDHYPNFPHHSQIAEYFNNYIDHFGVRPHIRFKTKVTAVEPLESGGWEITLHDNSTYRYRAMLVANGHHWNPRWPEPAFPGQFDGSAIHSHYYKTLDNYVDKHVLVVGFGNSAMDIAVEVSHVATMTYLSVRRGFYITPKHILGKPLDQGPLDQGPISSFLPFEWKKFLKGVAVQLQVGNLSQFGLSEPEHRYMDAHPTINSDIFNRLSHGHIKPKPNIERLDGDGVIFADGSRERIDKIIYATGYKVTFPFFRPEVVEVKNNELPLFRRVFHPHYHDLLFIGLLQPIGPVMPIAELQSQWVSKYLIGEYTLPSIAEMQQYIAQEREAIRKRYGNSARHTMQVDFEPYVQEVKKEMKRGALRARSAPLVWCEASPGELAIKKTLLHRLPLLGEARLQR